MPPRLSGPLLEVGAIVLAQLFAWSIALSKFVREYGDARAISGYMCGPWARRRSLLRVAFALPAYAGALHLLAVAAMGAALRGRPGAPAAVFDSETFVAPAHAGAVAAATAASLLFAGLTQLGRPAPQAAADGAAARRDTAAAAMRGMAPWVAVFTLACVANGGRAGKNTVGLAVLGVLCFGIGAVVWNLYMHRR